MGPTEPGGGDLVSAARRIAPSTRTSQASRATRYDPAKIEAFLDSSCPLGGITWRGWLKHVLLTVHRGGADAADTLAEPAPSWRLALGKALAAIDPSIVTQWLRWDDGLGYLPFRFDTRKKEQVFQAVLNHVFDRHPPGRAG